MSIGWLLLMLAGFIWISYRIWAGNEIALFVRMKQKLQARWFHFIIDSVDELFYLSLLTLVSYFFFNIHINILVLFIYLKLVEFALDLYRNKQKIKS